MPAAAPLSLAALATFALLTLVQWGEGGYSPGTFRPLHAMLAAYTPLMVGLVGLLDRSAEAAVDQMLPAFREGVDPKLLRYELTTLPRWPTLLAGSGSVVLLGALAWLVVGDLRLLEGAQTPLSISIFVPVMAATWWITGVFIYHTIRQLRIIYRTYMRSTRIEIFHLGPLYAFSQHTQRTALAILAFVYLDFLAADPGLRFHPLNLGAGGLLSFLALVAFIGPLGGVHRLMAAEKTRLLDENAGRLESALHELQHRADSHALDRIDDLGRLLNALEFERTALLRIPTWPWEPGTLRALAAAVVLPIVLWLMQFGLERMLR